MAMTAKENIENKTKRKQQQQNYAKVEQSNTQNSSILIANDFLRSSVLLKK